jgi:hypothetical protein
MLGLIQMERAKKFRERQLVLQLTDLAIIPLGKALQLVYISIRKSEGARSVKVRFCGPFDMAKPIFLRKRFPFDNNVFYAHAGFR